MDLEIKPGRQSDAKDANSKLSDIEQGDLILRDLGYFSIDTLLGIDNAKAFFISKLNVKVAVYEKSGGKMVKLDFGKLYAFMTKNNIPRIEKAVYIGEKEKMPLRMVINVMPDEQIEKRTRKITRYNKRKKHQVSDEYLNRLKFNLVITNLPVDIATSGSILLIYKLRWQIELMFKIWKSTFGIHTTRKMKIERFLYLLYSKLLLLTINWEIITNIRSCYYKKEGKLLSFDKCFKTISTRLEKFRKAMFQNKSTIKRFIQQLADLFQTKHWLEARKNKVKPEEILMLITDI